MQENLDRIINAANDTTNFYRFPSPIFTPCCAQRTTILHNVYRIISFEIHIMIHITYYFDTYYLDFALIFYLVNLLSSLVP